MKKTWYGLMTLGMAVLCVCAIGIMAEDDGNDEDAVVVNGTLTTVKNADGVVQSATLVAEEFNDNFEVVKAVYHIVIDAKGRSLCTAFSGKNVTVVGTVSERVKEGKPQKWLQVTRYSADELNPEQDQNMDDGE